ncbi:MAG: ABC transporter permease subunit [Planctomycetes bacterium]|nr:ABC transporter permease subunit [Planctomycetota bacterium]
MFGAVFTREATIAPRRVSFFAARTLFAAALFALTATAWQLLVGSQRLENVGDLAWFGASAFQILAQLQLAVAMPFSALLVASAVALEKDRKTLDLLLMTNLSNTELVLGKLLAGMLSVVVVVVAALPLLAIISLLGGISSGQIFRVQAVTLASALVAGSLGSTVALWREKTFQALAMTALVLVLWLVGWEIAAAGGLGQSWWGISTQTWATAMSPWQAVLAAAQAQFADTEASGLLTDPVHLFLSSAVAISALLNILAIALVRVWNPTREVQPKTELERQSDTPQSHDAAATADERVIRLHGAGGMVRPVWDNPILWREIRTWAFGKKILLIRLAYWAVFAACAAAVVTLASGSGVTNAGQAIPPAAKPLVALLVVGLILLNALAVTSITNERDSRALDLLLVTDLSPKEIVLGKLGGAFYNAKEMILLPTALCVYLWFVGRLTTENLVFLVGGLIVLTVFAATLGLHAGITYANSRTAIATSIGTLLFLFLGIATCMRIMLAFTDTFEYQFGAFLGAIAGGSLAMYVALGWRNPSSALGWASGITPFLTFFIITSFLLGNFGTVFLLTVCTYGFATAAMLVPAIYVFDVATGRTTAQEE